MTTRYALLDSAGKVRRVTKEKTHESALPVEYPDMKDVDRVTHSVRQKPIEEWEMKDDKVVPTYSIEPYDVEERKKLLTDRARERRKEAEATGTELEDGTKLRTDEGSQVRVTSLVTAIMADPDADNFDFEYLPGEWIKVTRDQGKEIGKAVSNHVQKCFTRCRELHEQIKAAEDMHDLKEVRINEGWPEGAE